MLLVLNKTAWQSQRPLQGVTGSFFWIPFSIIFIYMLIIVLRDLQVWNQFGPFWISKSACSGSGCATCRQPCWSKKSHDTLLHALSIPLWNTLYRLLERALFIEFRWWWRLLLQFCIRWSQADVYSSRTTMNNSCAISLLGTGMAWEVTGTESHFLELPQPLRHAKPFHQLRVSSLE
jgi:hypothetical protein